MRIAFLTPEFVTESDSEGGAANAVRKLAFALRDLGHDPEVFVHSKREPPVLDYHGIRVERAGHSPTGRYRLTRWLARPWDWPRILGLSNRPRPAIHLAAALAARERLHRFDAALSVLVDVAGVHVSRRRGRPHLVRVTASKDQLRADWGDDARSLTNRLVLALTDRQLRDADAIISPSLFSADRFQRGIRRPVHVLRTPAMIEVRPAADPPAGLPPRFLLHFGRLGPSKGTLDIAAALPLAWQSEPELQMIWAGKEIAAGDFANCRRLWPDGDTRVRWLGPVPKATLYAILQRAAAAVLPSRIDNLPNTAIESLMFGIPILGTRGTSLDELVEHGRSGELVDPAHPEQLAAAMVRLWRGESPCQLHGFQPPAILEEMQPKRAAQALVDLILQSPSR